MTVFDKISRFNFRSTKQSTFYVFGVLVASRERGTPDKRIPEGLF